MKIPEASPSLNKYAFSNWRVQYRDKQRWLMMLTVAAKEANATKATGKRSVHVERHGRRALDMDNGFGGLKPILDSLRKIGLLLDDDAKSLMLSFENCALLKGEKPHTVITISEVS
jgi:hypothetical protein